MKLLKRMTCLALALILTLGCLAGCKPEAQPDSSTNPTDGGLTATGPFRPEDPGVIAPLDDDSSFPENGVVWNMENLPDDLVEKKWATPNWASHDEFSADNISILGVNGKGYQGSRALAVRQNGTYNWSDVYTLGMKKDETAFTNWSSGKMFWLWYDTREIGSAVSLELELNGEHMKVGCAVFSMAEAETTAKRAGSTLEAYTGAGYARIPLKNNFVGWVGIPMEAFGENVRKVKSFNLHVSYNGQPKQGGALYLDCFCLTAENEGPMGAALSNANTKLATGDRAAWDMENLPNDPLAAGWANMDGAGWESYVAGNIRISGAAGCGVNGSRALGVYQAGSYNGADLFSLNMASDENAATDWSKGEMLWFWVNTSDLRDDLRLDLWLDNRRPAVGTTYYGINTSLQKQEAGTLPVAYDGASYGRIPIGANYVGWVGIPLSAFGRDIQEISNVQFHLAYSGGNSTGRTVYLDELWVTGANELPKTATGASITMLRGGLDGINPDVGEKLKLPAEVWSMEKLPSDPAGADMIYAAYPESEHYRAGNVSFARADGKGHDGTAALQIRQNGAYEGIDVFKIDLSRDSSAKRNWAGGKMLWIWMDTTEQSSAVKFDLSIDGARTVENAAYYTVAEGDKSAVERKASEAWTGCGYGRFALSNGFKGWVGIPFEAYPNGLSSASLLELHIAYAGEPTTGKSIYLDSFRVHADTTAPNGVEISVTEATDEKWNAEQPVWDMEKLPADLLASGWATSDYDYDAAFRKDNVQLLGAEGIGRGESRALELRFNGSYVWADVFTLNLKADSTAKTDWTGGKMLWFFVNAQSIQTDVEIELVLQGQKIAANSGVYTAQDGACVRKTDLITAWDGYGRVPVEAGFCGWLGVPLTGYGDISTVRNITVHVAGNGVATGASLYLDELWVTEENAVPVGAENGSIKEPEEDDDRSDLPLVVWDMEAVPSDPFGGIVSAPYSGSADFVSGNVTISAVDGKGHNASRALSIAQNGGYSWADWFALGLNRDATAVTDWNGGKMIWLWTDASAFATDISMEFVVDGRQLAINEPYYTAQSGETAVLAGNLTRAYDGANHARLPIVAGYVGWIGIPFSSFSRDPITAKTVEIHFGYSDSEAAKGKMFYLDALTLTDDATGPDGITIPAQAPSTDIPATAEKAAWDMENLPDDLLAQQWASAVYASHADHQTGNVTLLGAAGKGRGGSRALAICQNGDYNWSDEFEVAMSSDSTFCNDWSGGEMLMLWADASQCGSSLLLELVINGNKPANTTSYFMEKNGVLSNAGTLPDAWGGSAGWGRLPIAAGFKGWIAVPLSAFGNVRKVETIKLHLSYDDGTKARGSVLYLDDLWIFSGNEMPDGTVDGGSGSDPYEPEPEITTVLNEGQKQTSSSYLNIDPSKTYQTVKAYGVSDCWWTNAVGTRSSIAKLQELFFTERGIALNNYRVNIGGSVKDDLSDGPMSNWRAVLSPLAEDGTLDITRNAGGWNALRAVMNLVSSGAAQVDNYTLFMNSPPSTMTEKGQTYDNKLRAECYDDYAKYVADVVEAYQKAGVTVKYVSPINEPTGNWAGNDSQENCSYTASELVQVYEACIDALESRNLGVKLSIAEFNSWQEAQKHMGTLLASDKIATHIDHISVHSYAGSTSARTAVARKAAEAGIAVHMTEWCMGIGNNADNMDTALQLAEMLHIDMTEGNVDTWSWWLGAGAGGYSDALLYISESNSLYEVTRRFWAYGNYSKFTKGYTRIDASENHLADGLFATAYTRNNDDGTADLVYVLGNKNDTDTGVTFSGLPAGAKGSLYVTSDSYDCKQIGYVDAACGYTIPKKSVITVVFRSIKLSEVSSTAAPAIEPTQIGDMEEIVADLFAAEQATSYYPANVGAGFAEGKGFNGTNALGYVYKNLDGSNYWGNSVSLKTDGMKLEKNWTGAELLWFWVDASEFTTQLNLDFQLFDAEWKTFKPAVGANYYTWNGTGEAVLAGTLPDAWGGGAGFGRIPLPQSYKGFIGIPLSAYDGLSLETIQEIYFYIEPNNDATALPKMLYLDEFWLTAADGTPNVKVETLETTLIWNMENMPENLHSILQTTWSSVEPGDRIDGVTAAGKGVNSSTAFGYRWVANGDGNDFLRIVNLNTVSGYTSDWSGAEKIWLWVDTTEFSHAVNLDLFFNWARPVIGAQLYLWDGAGKPTTGEKVPTAWTGANYGRIPIPQGYKGYIGLAVSEIRTEGGTPLADMLGNITELFLYYETTDARPKTLYIDELRIS